MSNETELGKVQLGNWEMAPRKADPNFKISKSI